MHYPSKRGRALLASRTGASALRLSARGLAAGHRFTYADHSSLRCTISATRPAALFCSGKDSKLVAIMQVMPTPIRTVAPAIAFITVGFYWWFFLTQPLVDGNAEINRAQFVLASVLYPEGYFIGSWTDDGRLPLACLDRLPIIAGTLLWLALATIVGWPWCVHRVPAASLGGLPSRLVQISLACLIGLALLSTLILLIGLMGGLSSRWALLMGVAVLVVVSHWLARRFKQNTIAPIACAVDAL